jgi:(1->4)-alpha-D-glucan 1-alpha-D-glucosylmutase
LIAEVLACARPTPSCFARRYTPLEVVGQHAERVVAFCREYQGRALVVVPRWPYPLLENGVHPQINAQVWGDTRVVLPFAAPDKTEGTFSQQRSHKKQGAVDQRRAGDFPVNPLSILTITTSSLQEHCDEYRR